VIGQRDGGFSERVVDPQAFDGRLVGWDHLKSAPEHALAHRDRVFLGDRTPLINVGRLNLTNTNDVSSKLDSLLLEMFSRLLWRSEEMTFGARGPLESRALLVADLREIGIDLGWSDRTPSDGSVPFLPLKCWR